MSSRTISSFSAHPLATAFATAALLTGSASHAAEPGQPGKVSTAIAKATAAVRADADMKAVLDAHAGLKPKAIEKLTPAELASSPPLRMRSTWC